MVAVIVDHGRDPAAGGDFPDLGEAPLHAPELGEAVLDRRVIDAHLQRHADRRHGVQYIVAARHRHFDALDPAERTVPLANLHVEAVAAGDRLDILAAYIGLRREAIGHDPPVLGITDI